MNLGIHELDDFLVYLKLFEKMNKELLLMYGVRTLENDAFSKYYYTTDEFCDAFFRVTGYEYSKSDDKLITLRKNGILSLTFIVEVYDPFYDLENLLKDYFDLIKKLKLFRNKA